MDETEANPSKFVIRKLPPNLCEADFHKMLTDVCQDELEWFRYHPGRFTCALDHRSCCSRSAQLFGRMKRAVQIIKPVTTPDLAKNTLCQT